jgi:hypothetical protein
MSLPSSVVAHNDAGAYGLPALAATCKGQRRRATLSCKARMRSFFAADGFGRWSAVLEVQRRPCGAGRPAVAALPRQALKPTRRS